MGRSAGFTLVEIMVVVLIIGILVAIAVPVYVGASLQVGLRVCFANQRVLEGTVSSWQSTHVDESPTALAGVIDSSHPFVVGGYVSKPPRCPAAPSAADPNNPTPAEGAYTFDATGTSLEACVFGLGPHGHY